MAFPPPTSLVTRNAEACVLRHCPRKPRQGACQVGQRLGEVIEGDRAVVGHAEIGDDADAVRCETRGNSLQGRELVGLAPIPPIADLQHPNADSSLEKCTVWAWGKSLADDIRLEPWCMQARKLIDV